MGGVLNAAFRPYYKDARSRTYHSSAPTIAYSASRCGSRVIMSGQAAAELVPASHAGHTGTVLRVGPAVCLRKDRVPRRLEGFEFGRAKSGDEQPGIIDK